MLCLEVSVNGERKTLAGVADAETLSAAIRSYPGLGESNVLVTGEVLPTGQPTAEAKWFSCPLKVGDEVSVRLVDSNDPSPVQLGRVNPTNVATDSVPIICAFCGKPHTDVEAMIASTRAFICRACVMVLYELATEPASEA